MRKSILSSATRRSLSCESREEVSPLMMRKTFVLFAALLFLFALCASSEVSTAFAETRKPKLRPEPPFGDDPDDEVMKGFAEKIGSLGTLPASLVASLTHGADRVNELCDVYVKSPTSRNRKAMLQGAAGALKDVASNLADVKSREKEVLQALKDLRKEISTRITAVQTDAKSKESEIANAKKTLAEIESRVAGRMDTIDPDEAPKAREELWKEYREHTILSARIPLMVRKAQYLQARSKRLRKQKKAAQLALDSSREFFLQAELMHIHISDDAAFLEEVVEDDDREALIEMSLAMAKVIPGLGEKGDSFSGAMGRMRDQLFPAGNDESDTDSSVTLSESGFRRFLRDIKKKRDSDAPSRQTSESE